MRVSSLISYIGAYFKLHSERTNSFFFGSWRYNYLRWQVKNMCDRPRLSVPSVDLRCDVSNGHLLWTTNIEHLYKEMLNSATVCGSWSSWCKCLVWTYNIISTKVLQPLSETIISYGEKVEVVFQWMEVTFESRQRKRKNFFLRRIASNTQFPHDL